MKDKTQNHLIVFFIFLNCFITQSISQDLKQSIAEEQNFNKHAIYGNIGVGYVSASLTGYHEKTLTKYAHFTSFRKTGFGMSTTFFDGDLNLLLQYVILTGKKWNHLELGIGPSVLIVAFLTNKKFIPISSTIGWRIQKPNRHFIFRTGISWPEGAYLGFGYSY
jgi:hypothetical protein